MARRPSSRSRRRGGQNSIVHYILAGLIASAALTGIGFLLYLKEPLVQIDKETLCPIDGPSAVTTIVIDRTDSIDITTKTQIENKIHDLVGNLQTGEELTLYEVGGSADSFLQPIVLICSPQDPDEVDPLTGSVPLAKRRWAEKFLAPVVAVLDQLLSEKEAPVSPILESIQAVSIARFDKEDRRDLPRRLIVISDMLQNSDTVSFYRGIPDVDKFLETKSGRSLLAEMNPSKSVEVQLWYILRNSKAQGEAGQAAAFFNSWILRSGGRVTNLVPLVGMNN